MNFAESLSEQACRAKLIGKWTRNRALANSHPDPLGAAMAAEQRAHSGEAAEEIVSSIAGEYRRKAA